MLILFLFILIVFQLIIGIHSDQNPDATYEACGDSCPFSPFKICPNRCINFNGNKNSKCWEKFCKICNKKFNNNFLPDTQQTAGESSSSNWGQNENLDEQISSVQNDPNYYNTWDEIVTPLPTEFQAMNLNEVHLTVDDEALSNQFLAYIKLNLNKNDRNKEDDYELLMMFYRRIILNAYHTCTILQYPTLYQTKPLIFYLCTKIEHLKTNIELIINLKQNNYDYKEFWRTTVFYTSDYESGNESVINPFGSDKFRKIWDKNYDLIHPKEDQKIGDWRVPRIKKLNGHVKQKYQLGVEQLKIYKQLLQHTNDEAFDEEGNPRFTDFTQFHKLPDDIRSKIKCKIASDCLKQAQINATECTVGIHLLCLRGTPYVDGYSLRTGLSIFAIELFITSFDIEEFDHLVGLKIVPWTQLLCEKVERIDQTYIKITSYFKSYDALFTVEFVKMSIYLYNYYTGKSKFCEENVTQKRYNELNGKINLRINSDNEKQRLINLQKLNDYIDEMIGNGLKFLPFLKNFEFDSELLKKFPPEIKKKIKQNIYQNLKDIGCEITLAVKTLCEQVSVNCNQIKPALSIFAVDIFITSIMANDFDKLAGKWPIAIFKNFDEN
ncbi:hypothetical protein Mgra_00003082 [Meloidogyne graminicola]|uniref:Uncharacterized protein n=1 Tax=Meloidogyne graminicola TaxID=189291 RepID=A0A8S9ZWX6_9BILA|nr:hypothetical protein Mgra_00003082 [Meloidogyne graminicola]